MKISIKKIVFNYIKDWPDYQSLPETSVVSFVKLKLRLYMVHLSGIFFVRKEMKNRLNQTKKLKGSKLGKSILLVVSGPSSDPVLSKISNSNNFRSRVDIAVVNSYFKSVHSESVIPDYYFFSDPIYWEQKDNAEAETHFLLNYIMKYSEIIPVTPFIQENLTENRKSYYVNTFSSYKKNFKLDPTKSNLVPSGVVFHAITFLSYLGYWPIYICGLDASYNRNVTVNELNEVIMNPDGLYFQFQDKFLKDNAKKINVSNDSMATGAKSMGEFLVAEAILIRDLGYYKDCGLVNVSKNETIDTLPKASLLI
jgi:hypothetical protein